MRNYAITLVFYVFIIAQTTPELGIKNTFKPHYAYTDATLIHANGDTVKQALLLVRGEHIQYAGPAKQIPSGYTRIPLKGKFIYPGFIDLYAHYGIRKAPKHPRPKSPQYKGKRSSTDYWNDAVHSDKNWISQFNSDTKEAKEYLENGFTVVNSFQQNGIFRGKSVVTALSNKRPNFTVLIPQFQHALSFNKGNSVQSYPTSLMGSIALIRQVFYDVEWYKNAHNAFKQNPFQTQPELNTALENLVQEKSFLFDPENDLSMLRAQKIADEFKFSFAYLGTGHEYKHLSFLKKKKPFLIMPLNLPEKPALNYENAVDDVSLHELRHWETAPYLLSDLSKSKIPFSLTLHRLKKKNTFLSQIRTFISHGLSEKDALNALTIAPANYLGLKTRIGQLKKNYYANFIVTDGPIFSENSQILATFVQGEKHEFKPLDNYNFPGKYQLNIATLDATLTLEEGKKLTGKLTVGKKSFTVKHINTFKNQIQFSTSVDTVLHSGVYRFTGFANEDKSLSGYARTPKNDRVSWTAAFKQMINKKDKKKQKKSFKKQSSLTYPNLAFGNTSLPKQQSVLIKNVTVWTSEKEGILKHTDVYVKNGRFEEIGKNLSVPKNTLIIDGTGKHLTAGIIDEHSHIAISQGVNEGSHSITAEVHIGDVVNPTDINIYRQLSGGVTTSQLLHGSANPIGGQAQVIKLRWGHSAEEMKFHQAPPSIKFALGENVKQSNWGDRFNTRYPQTRMGVESFMRDRFNNALAYQNEWNAYNDLSRSEKRKTVPPRKNIQLDVLLEILNGKRFVHCHSYVQSEILMLMRLAEEYGFKISTFTHILEGYKVADEMRKHGAMASTFSDWWAYKFEVKDAIPHNAGLMAEKGVVTSINSDDAEMGRRLNQEAAKSILYTGISQEEAWKMVTINPAKQLMVDQYVGSIKESKHADFVLWTANPLSVYATVEQTWIEGKQYFSKEKYLEKRLQVNIEKASLIQKVLQDKHSKSSGKPPAKTLKKEWHCEEKHDVWSSLNNH